MTMMPKLPVDDMCAGFPDREAQWFRAAFNSRTGRLRATKPYRSIDFDGDLGEALDKGRANYIWRMLCFDYVGSRPHSCIPCTADWDICAVYSIWEKQGRYTDRKARTDGEKYEREGLDAMIKQAESVLPVTAQDGAMQAMRAFGLV